MKKIVLLGTVMAFALLAGCQDSAKNTQLATCQEEKAAIQGQLDQANAAIVQKDQLIAKQKADIREVNQKALEGIRTMMEKQNARDIEQKNKIKAKEAEAAELLNKVQALEEQLKPAKTATETTGQ